MTDESTITQEGTPEQTPAQASGQTAPDAQLAAARDFAHGALRALEPAETIGEGHRVRAEGDLVVTHLFPSAVRGYRGWEWYVTLTRAPGSAEPTVCETGMLPGEDALLAPAWVPWSERVLDTDHESADEGDDDRTASASGDDEHGDAAPSADAAASAESADSPDSADSADEADGGAAEPWDEAGDRAADDQQGDGASQ